MHGQQNIKKIYYNLRNCSSFSSYSIDHTLSRLVKEIQPEPEV